MAEQVHDHGDTGSSTYDERKFGGIMYRLLAVRVDGKMTGLRIMRDRARAWEKNVPEVGNIFNARFDESSFDGFIKVWILGRPSGQSGGGERAEWLEVTPLKGG